MTPSSLDIFIPDHAYIPGQNSRHGEDLFERIKLTAQKGMPLEMIRDCSAITHGIYYLEHGFYWECHEVLEAVWMALIDYPDEREVIQGVIQIANGCLKFKMGQPKAAHRLYEIASSLLAHYLTESSSDQTHQHNIWHKSGLSSDMLKHELSALNHKIAQYNA